MYSRRNSVIDFTAVRQLIEQTYVKQIVVKMVISFYFTVHDIFIPSVP